MKVPLIVVPAWTGVPGLVHGFSTRAGGVSQGSFFSLNLGFGTGDDPSSVRENYRRLSETAGVPLSAFRTLRQVHGVGIVLAESAASSVDPENSPEGDAMVSDGVLSVPMVRVADCFPVLLLDRLHHAVGICHAGWRGTLGGIVPRTIRAMHERFASDPSELEMAVGPGIGRGNFRVSSQVAALFEAKPGAAPDEISKGDGFVRIDLSAINNRLAIAEGVRAERIWSCGACTFSDAGRFFSYRRDGKTTGRMVGFIGWSS